MDHPFRPLEAFGPDNILEFSWRFQVSGWVPEDALMENGEFIKADG